MAEMIPPTPFAGSTREIVRVFGVLKRLPDSCRAYQKLHAGSDDDPDFWITLPSNRALLFIVSPLTAQQIASFLQPNLLAGSAPFEGPGTAEKNRFDRFMADRAALAEGMPCAVVFPNLANNRQLEGVLPEEATYPLHWLCRDTLQPAALNIWLDTHAGAPLDDDTIALWRAQFTPEVIVPQTFTVRRVPQRHVQATLLPQLLDYNQERVLKTDLDLNQQARQTSSDYGVRLVKGVAGSGKSLIIIYRAHLLRQLFPRKQIIGFTHNRALVRDLERRYLKLSEGDTAVIWDTFIHWCLQEWPRMVPRPDIIRYRKRRDLIARVHHEHLAGSALSSLMFQEEIDWYKDRLLFSEADYLAADRTGRGFALSLSMRKRVYAALRDYNQRLTLLGLIDWGDVPRLIWRDFQAGDLALPRYDAVLVDEAQFFAPIWFELIKYLVRPRTGHLFLVADGTQGFLRRGQSWISSGLEVRGRSQRLVRSYRTTREILSFATLLYRNRVPYQHEDEDILAPSLDDMPHGSVPVIVQLTSRQDELTRVINEIRQLVSSGIPFEHILVIHAGSDNMPSMFRRYQRDLGVNRVSDPRQSWQSGSLRLCPLNGATGLESPIVFITGIQELYEREQSARLSDDERLELIRDNTRRLYMAITRAGQRLILTYPGRLPTGLLEMVQNNYLATAPTE